MSQTRRMPWTATSRPPRRPGARSTGPCATSCCGTRRDATETLSYNMPTFVVDGHRLLHASAWKEHLAIYPLPPAEDLDAEATAALEAHSSGASTLKLLYREEFPTDSRRRRGARPLARVAAGR